jgi:hypothetical protein
VLAGSRARLRPPGDRGVCALRDALRTGFQRRHHHRSRQPRADRCAHRHDGRLPAQQAGARRSRRHDPDRSDQFAVDPAPGDRLDNRHPDGNRLRQRGQPHRPDADAAAEARRRLHRGIEAGADPGQPERRADDSQRPDQPGARAVRKPGDQRYRHGAAAQRHSLYLRHRHGPRGRRQRPRSGMDALCRPRNRLRQRQR